MTYMTINEVIEDCTDSELSKMSRDDRPSPRDIERILINAVKDVCLLDNQLRPKGDKLVAPNKLVPAQVAAVMLKFHPIVKIQSGGSGLDSDYDLLAIYKEEGPDEGIYVTDDAEFRRIAHMYNYTISKREIDQVMMLISMYAPRVERCMDRDLVAVNNGIFNYVEKKLLPFDPEYVFTSKCMVDYDCNAVNVVIHNDEDGTDWDVESWLEELSDDPEIVDLFWQIMSAIIRPYVRWNKSAFLYSSQGNNGKGTLCELMRNLCGKNSFASIPLSDFGKDFALEPLIRTQAIIVDENDVGTYIDKAANLKAVITNDVISINRKFKSPIAYQFYGFMVQCLNEFPRLKDKSDSWYRRQLFIPFTKCFTGHERRYIKNDYIKRPEVLEYVLYRVLHTDFYELSEPDACKQVLDDFKEYNDPVRQFLDEMLPQLKWDLVPFRFLYDLYKSWFQKNSPSGTAQGRNTFIKDVGNVMGSYPDWSYHNDTHGVRTGKRISVPEPLIVDYRLTDWMSTTYMGSDPDRIAMPSKLADAYRGLLRRGAKAGDAVQDDDVPEDNGV